MPDGTITFFNPDRGFGFIKPDTGRDNLFVHITDCLNATDLREGQRVRFEQRPDDNGKRQRAIAVSVVADAR